MSGTITGETSDDWGAGAVNFSSPHYPPVVGEKFSIVLNTEDYNHNLYWTTFSGLGIQTSSLDVTPLGFSIYLKELYGPPDYNFRLNLATSDSAFNARTVGLTEYSGSYFDLTSGGGFYDSGVTPYFDQPGLASRRISFRVDNISIVYATPDSGPSVVVLSVIILGLFRVYRRKMSA